MSIQCKHGYLSRACDRCEMEEEIANLKHDIERQQSACSEHLEEIERLRAFVAAWDAAENALPGRADYSTLRYAVLVARKAVGTLPVGRQPLK